MSNSSRFHLNCPLRNRTNESPKFNWDEATRTAARTIRNRLRDRQEDPALLPGAGPWPEYVNDVVRSARDQVYTPPETVLPSEGLSS